MEKIMFTSKEGEGVELYVLEQTRLGGVDYILVTESGDGDGDALVLKDVSEQGEADALYEIVDDDEELDAVASIFSEMLEDIDLEKD